MNVIKSYTNKIVIDFFLRYSVLEILKTLQKIKKCLYVHEIERKSIIMKHHTFIIKIMMHWISSKDNSCVIIYNDQNINIPQHNLSASSKKSESFSTFRDFIFRLLFSSIIDYSWYLVLPVPVYLSWLPLIESNSSWTRFSVNLHLHQYLCG